MRTRAGVTGNVEWAIAELALHDAEVSGDAALVMETETGVLLVAIDGLGHGPGAFEASSTAVAAIEGNSRGPVEEILERVHREIGRTRGAVVSLAAIEGGMLRWVGVGNVEGMLIRRLPATRERLLLWGGVVGHNLPKLRASSLPLNEDDLLVFATDGLRPDFGDVLSPGEAPAVAVANAFSRAYSGRDDGLILAARCRRREA